MKIPEKLLSGDFIDAEIAKKWKTAKIVKDADNETPNIVETKFGKKIRLTLLKGKEGKLITINKTSARQLTKAWKDELDNWVDKDVKLTVNNENVRGTMRDVIYLSPA